MPNSLNAGSSLEALRYRLDAILAEIESVGSASPALQAAKAAIAHAGIHIENHFKAEQAYVSAPGEENAVARVRRGGSRLLRTRR